MTKNIKNIVACIIALSALVLTGCSSEETLVVPNIPLEKGNLSFVIPLGSKSAVTYATPVPGQDSEYEIKDLRIYWFKDADDKLSRVYTYPNGDITLSDENLTASANTTTATIRVGDDANASKFYIIANVGSASSTFSAALDAVNPGTTTRTEFEAILADDLPKTGDDIPAIVTPLPMSIRDASPTAGGYITVDDPAGTGLVSDVHLKRRVARFDIINTAAWSNFEVTNVVISRAQRTVILQDKPFTGSETWAANTGNLLIDASRANGPAGSGLDDGSAGGIANNGVDDAFDPGESLEADSAKLAESVFYLYPTLLKKDNSATEIMIEGKYYGKEPRLYKLDLAADLAIEANKVYRIKIIGAKDERLQATLIVDEWDDELEIQSSEIGQSVTSWGSLKSGSTELDLTVPDQKFEYSSSLTDSVKVTIVTEGTNLTTATTGHVTTVKFYYKNGAAADVDYLTTDYAATTAMANVKSTTVLTYGTHYTTTHVITLAPTDAPLETELRVANAANSKDYKTITLFSNNYAKTGIPPLKVGDLYWAPVNVGADKLPPNCQLTVAPVNNVALTTNDTTRRIVGSLYQWGRNVAFPFNGTISPVHSTAVTPATNLDSLNTLGSFIKTSGVHVDWITPATGITLWQNAADQPCPPGWRMPSQADWESLIAGSTGAAPTAKGHLSYFTINGKFLYIPYAGYRDNAAASQGFPSTGAYWTTTLGANDGENQIYVVNNKLFQSNGHSMGYSIRAVRDIPPVAPEPPAAP